MCNTCTLNLDTGRSEAFGQRMLGVLNDAAIALMCSIGHRTGLFDTLAALPPSTTGAIARRAGLSQRYVREWLGAMTTARIVEHDPDAGTYHLPAEHAALLTRGAGSDNIAQTLQWFAVLGEVEDDVVRAFGDGRGVPYSAYRRFNEVMAAESDNTVVLQLLDRIVPLDPGLRARLEQGIDVLDVGCGLGRAMIHLAETFPDSRFVGYDLLDDAVAGAKAEADRRGLTNVRFEVRDAALLDDESAFDLVCTFDSVHDQARPDAMLRNIRRALRPGGTYLMQDIQGTSSHHGDIDHPIAPFIYTISTMHCMSVSLARDGMGLGAAWGKATALRMLGQAGFDRVRVEELEHDFINYYYIAS